MKKHASLFSGIGGFDLAAQWMGWENVFQVEIDSFCQKVLEKNFPNVARYGDIKEFDGTKYRGAIDILTGGFPCQPFSTAGQRKGTEDDRHLWPQMLRVIREIQPRWIVGENVSGLLNLSGGMVLKQIKIDLEAEGYSVIPPIVLPACSKNAPHRRDRLWIIAYSKSYFGDYEHRGESNPQKVQEERFDEPESSSNTNLQRFSKFKPSDLAARSELNSGNFINDWTKWPTQPPVCGRDDGISDRAHRIKSLGNAIVPQVAFEIFKAIDMCSKKH